MTDMDSKVLGGIAGLITIFVVGAVFGRVAGTSDTARGDRVMSGLIAMPLIAVATRLAIPGVSIAWAIAAPLPIGVYVILLAYTDSTLPESTLKTLAKSHFSRTLLFAIGALYVAAALAALAHVGRVSPRKVSLPRTDSVVTTPK